jgi:hypothetical protein
VVGCFAGRPTSATVEGQVAAAFLGDMGITSPLHPDENCNPGDEPGRPDGGSPEVPKRFPGRVKILRKRGGAGHKHVTPMVVPGGTPDDRLRLPHRARRLD